MLVQRVITALVLLPLLLAAIWFLPTPWLYALLGAASLLVAWEWTTLMGLDDRNVRIAYVVLTAVCLALAWLLRSQWIVIMFAAALWWAYAVRLLRQYPHEFKERPAAWRMAVIGQVLVVPTILALALLHRQGVLILIYFLFLVFAADTGAYLAGRNFGRRKLAPAVSPGKTVEGALGGLILCGLWALIAGTYTFGADASVIARLVVLSLLVAVVSMIGDLTESMFKRISGVKDSGTILPGHGGLLDRVDSILAAAPVMALGLHLLRL